MISDLTADATDAATPAGHVSDWADDILATAAAVAITWFVVRRALAWWRATPQPPRIGRTTGDAQKPAGAGDAPKPAGAGDGQVQPATGTAQPGADPEDEPLSTRAF